MIGLSLLKAEFLKNGDIVKDSVSKLEWQDNAVGSTMTWEDAITHCEELSLGGHSDWRLPNINELKSIVDRSKDYPAIVNGFENTSSNYYWSSTTNENFKNRAWLVGFGGGYVNYYGKDYNYYVRCVRDGQ